MATEAQPGGMIAAGRDALACGAWAEARAAFERALAEQVEGAPQVELAEALLTLHPDRLPG